MCFSSLLPLLSLEVLSICQNQPLVNTSGIAVVTVHPGVLSTFLQIFTIFNMGLAWFMPKETDSHAFCFPTIAIVQQVIPSRSLNSWQMEQDERKSAFQSFPTQELQIQNTFMMFLWLSGPFPSISPKSPSWKTYTSAWPCPALLNYLFQFSFPFYFCPSPLHVL